MGKNIFKYRLEKVEDITSQTFYHNFLDKEKRESRYGKTIYILVSNISFNFISKIAWDIGRLNNNLKTVIIFNESSDTRNLVRKFMNNVHEGNSSIKGDYSRNANTLRGMMNNGQLEFKVAKEKYHLNVISGHTTLLGIESLAVNKNFKNGYVFWEDYEDYTAEVRNEVEIIYRNSVDEPMLTELLEYIRRNYRVDDMYYLMLLNIFQVQDYTKEKSEIASLEMSKKSLWKQLYEFQQDGVYGLVHRLNKNSFALLGDSVGLGKTYQALAVLQYYQDTRGYKGLVLTPVKLYENWQTETSSGNASKLRKFKDISFTYHVHYHTTVTSKSTPQKTSTRDIDYTIYDILVIDEAHAFRNSKSKRYIETINKIISVNPQIKVLLLSATPVNNALSDLEALINLMVKGAKKITVDSELVDYKKILKNAEYDIEENKEPSVIFYDLLNEILVSRDKSYVKEIYKNSNMKFPEKKPVISLVADTSKNESDYINEFYDKISNMDYAMYNYYEYMHDERKMYYRKQSINISERSQGMKYLMRLLLLKRYESTFGCLKSTIDKMIEQMEQWKNLLEDNPEQFVKNIIENDSLEILAENEEENSIDILKLNVVKSDFKPEFFEAIDRDISTLRSIVDNDVYRVISKKKIKLLIKEVNKINGKGEKVIIFTSYKDTAEEISHELLKLNIDHGLVTGTSQKIINNKMSIRQSSYEEVLIKFSPKSKFGESNEYELDVLVATDVISEGQNLQDCSNIINFDVHWNPVRIIQRLGRIDRLASEHEYINNYIFWPVSGLEEYLNMRNRIDLKNKLIQAVGAEGYELDSDFNTTKEQLEKVAEGIDIDDNKIKLSSKDMQLKKFEIDYKAISQHIKEDSIFYNVIDFVHELRGVSTYVYSNTVTSSCYLLYRVDTSTKFSSDLYPYILIELDEDLRIKSNQMASLEVIQNLYAKSLLVDFEQVSNNDKKIFYKEELRMILKKIPNYIEKNFEGVKQEKLNLVASIYVLPSANNYNNSDLDYDLNESVMSFDEIESDIINSTYTTESNMSNTEQIGIVDYEANSYFKI